MKKIVFATNNAHKLQELRGILGDSLEVLSLNDIGCHDDIPENEPTLEGNALAKARWVHDRYGFDCFADDTGLFVDALDGAPGVYSARYAGPGHDSTANMRLLLENLEGVATEGRTAHFRTVFALMAAGETHLFDGRIDGHILDAPAGEAGFGYDPVFVPDGYSETFAQMPAALKNSISHRALATKELIKFLNTKN